jgi:hypothetical protein
MQAESPPHHFEIHIKMKGNCRRGLKGRSSLRGRHSVIAFCRILHFCTLASNPKQERRRSE